MTPAQVLRRSCLAVLAVAAGAVPLFADSSSGFSLGASGNASVYADLAYPESTAVGLGAPGVIMWLGSDLLLAAESPSALFRLRLGAYAESDKLSNVVATDSANALSLEIREAEATLLPADSLAIRGGMLLRSFGVGAYGSPVNPFARDVVFLGQSGYWGLDTEWTLSPDVSTLAILSADRMARKGSFSGLRDLDSGALIRFSPGALDLAAGVYASGAAGGELRPIGYVSVPILTLLGSVEAALSVPLGDSGRSWSESVRFELQKSMNIGEASLNVGAAYRGIFPGRSEKEIADLVAQTSPADLAVLPFAPFFGQNYAEVSLSLEMPNVFSLVAAADVALPWGSLSAEAKADVYVGDASLFVRVQGVVGEAGGEFNGLALAGGLPGLEIWTGVELSF